MTVTVLGVGLLLPSLAQPSQDRGEGSSMERPGHTDRLSTHPASAWAGPSVAWRGMPSWLEACRVQAQYTPWEGWPSLRKHHGERSAEFRQPEGAPGQSPLGSERHQPRIRSTSGAPKGPSTPASEHVWSHGPSRECGHPSHCHGPS